MSAIEPGNKLSPVEQLVFAGEFDAAFELAVENARRRRAQQSCMNPIRSSFTDRTQWDPPPVVMCALCLSRFSSDGLDQCPGCGAPDENWRVTETWNDRC